MRVTAIGLLFVFGLGACASKRRETAGEVPAAAVKPAKPAPAKKTKKPTRVEPAAAKKTKPDEPKPPPAPACPDDMQAVQGDYCRAVEQKCLEPVVVAQK